MITRRYRLESDSRGKRTTVFLKRDVYGRFPKSLRSRPVTDVDLPRDLPPLLSPQAHVYVFALIRVTTFARTTAANKRRAHVCNRRTLFVSRRRHRHLLSCNERRVRRPFERPTSVSSKHRTADSVYVNIARQQ